MVKNSPATSASQGKALLEAQHERLFGLSRQASTLIGMTPPGDRESFHELLNDLATHFREHFAAEENFLRQTRPELLKEHIAEHITYESRLMEILISASTGMLDKYGLQRLLDDWQAAHVNGLDMLIP